MSRADTSATIGHSDRPHRAFNDQAGLSKSVYKLYFQDFPEEVRLKTLVTRDRDEVERFVERHGGRAVMKPLR